METANTKPETINDAAEETPVTEDVDTSQDNTTQVSDATDGDAAEVKKEDTFNRSYVEKLRKENADYRSRAKDRDDVAAERDNLARRLHVELVRADGRLADPDDLEFNAEHLDDADALAEAIGQLISRKPGLKARQYGGDVGAGKRGTPAPAPADLIEIIKSTQGR